MRKRWLQKLAVVNSSLLLAALAMPGPAAAKSKAKASSRGECRSVSTAQDGSVSAHKLYFGGASGTQAKQRFSSLGARERKKFFDDLQKRTFEKFKCVGQCSECVPSVEFSTSTGTVSKDGKPQGVYSVEALGICTCPEKAGNRTESRRSDRGDCRVDWAAKEGDRDLSKKFIAGSSAKEAEAKFTSLDRREQDRLIEKLRKRGREQLACVGDCTGCSLVVDVSRGSGRFKEDGRWRGVYLLEARGRCVCDQKTTDRARSRQLHRSRTLLDVSGTYVDSLVDGGGRLKLQQSGQNVTGQYQDGKGRLTGVLTGNRLTGSFVRSDFSPPVRGRFEFLFDPSAASFEGHWHNTSVSGSGTWNGYAVKPAAGETGPPKHR